MSEASSKERHHNTILFATELPFWRQQTGAQQRILSLIQILSAQGREIITVYIGSLQISADGVSINLDRARIERLRLNVISLIDGWQPQGMVETLAWQVKCIGNSISSRLMSAASPRNAFSHGRSRRLADFEDLELKRRFERLVNQLRPEIVVIEYITLSYLVPPKDKRQEVQYWVDTHDLLSSRCAQFRERGLEHWIEVTETEEAEVLKKFDGIIAIEQAEAEKFRELTDNRVPIVVAGFASQVMPANRNALERNTRAELEITIGMIASENAINIAGLNWFLNEVWPKLDSNSDTKRPKGTIKLILAGSVCANSIVTERCSSNFIGLGIVDELGDFYDRIQIAINPIQFGTGLKIKSIEALSFGKPLIAHRHSVTGLPGAGQELPLIACDTSDEMAVAILELARNPRQLEAMSDSAKVYADRFLRPETVYDELLKYV